MWRGSVEAVKLPPCFFDILIPQSGKTGKVEAFILPDALLEQYNVGHFFSNELRFRHVLLSPCGIECHKISCLVVSACFCVSSLRVCLRGKSPSCYKSIWISHCIPKLSIANGKYIGLLPTCTTWLTAFFVVSVLFNRLVVWLHSTVVIVLRAEFV